MICGFFHFHPRNENPNEARFAAKLETVWKIFGDGLQNACAVFSDGENDTVNASITDSDLDDSRFSAETQKKKAENTYGEYTGADEKNSRGKLS